MKTLAKRPSRSSEPRFKKINPASKNEVLGSYPRSGKPEVERAVAKAKEAFANWSNVPGPERGAIFFRAATKFAERKEEIARLIVGENGKPFASALAEVDGAVELAQFYAGEGRRLYGQTTPSASANKAAMSVRCPVGVVGAITSWNNPLAAFCWKVFPALICGNTVVLKPAEDTPGTAELAEGILEEAGLPSGVLNLVQGLGHEAGRTLVLHPDIAMISFTGSTEVGREIAEACGRNLKKVLLECGGKNNLIVLEDAEIDKAVDAAVSGAFSNAGQKCANTGRVLLHRKIASAFKEKFIEKTKKLVLGQGFDSASQIGPVINAAQLARIEKFVSDAVHQGAHVLAGGKVETRGICREGFYFQPTILEGAALDSEIAQEEVFGPVTVLFEFSSFDQAIKMANHSRYGLTNSIYTQDLRYAFEFLKRIESGVAYVNAPTAGAEIHLPFGGWKQSGNGFREAGQASLDAYSEWKSLYVSY